MKVKLTILENVTRMLFKHLKNQGINEVEVTEDFYWDISQEERYNPYKEPTKFDLGQLEEDWKEMVKLDKKKEAPIAYSFVWLANLLRILGEKVVK